MFHLYILLPIIYLFVALVCWMLPPFFTALYDAIEDTVKEQDLPPYAAMVVFWPLTIVGAIFFFVVLTPLIFLSMRLETWAKRIRYRETPAEKEYRRRQEWLEKKRRKQDKDERARQKHAMKYL